MLSLLCCDRRANMHPTSHHNLCAQLVACDIRPHRVPDGARRSVCDLQETAGQFPQEAALRYRYRDCHECRLV